MKIVKSKILNDDVIVIAENKDEYEEAREKSKELDCALYTTKEISYLTEFIDGMTPSEKRAYLFLVNGIKKSFDAFFQIPPTWTPKNR